MHVDTSTIRTKNKSYTRYLLRESFREQGKVKHRTIANISSCLPKEIEALRLALKHKGDLTQIGSLKNSFTVEQGLAVGAVWLLNSVAKDLGITKALGHEQNGKLALWQVLARVIDQGSRLSAVRLASSHAACDILDLKKFNEDDLYENLDWLCEHQELIEDRLFKTRMREGKKISLFLYDVTSSYLEGKYNELGDFGYNRDGKKHKRQIVVGLLCDEEGVPLSIEVFRGNTGDTKTMASQIEKVARRFGATEVTFVGDRGMIRSGQIKNLGENEFHYITAITRAQIESMIKLGTFQMSLFDNALAEVFDKAGLRYVFRRNPVRAKEIEKSREEKFASLKKEVTKQNEYLKTHIRAQVVVAKRKVLAKGKQLKIGSWVKVDLIGRVLEISADQVVLDEAARLDGCYVLKTDLMSEAASKETIHARYKDLALVEKAFRNMKTVELDLRPIHVRLESRTRGHALVVMLAYMIMQELAKRWVDIDNTVEEGIGELSSLCTTVVTLKGDTKFNQVPKPRAQVEKLFNLAGVILPHAIPCKGIIVTTKKKLPERRKNANT